MRLDYQRRANNEWEKAAPNNHDEVGYPFIRAECSLDSLVASLGVGESMVVRDFVVADMFVESRGS